MSASLKIRRNLPAKEKETPFDLLQFQFVQNAVKLLENEMSWRLSRDERSKSGLDASNRNLDAECGYPVNGATSSQYAEMYRFNSLAGRVVNGLPDECFLGDPEVYEDPDATSLTPFEQDFLEVRTRHPDLFSTLKRADRESRYARYGGLLVGIADDKDPATPLGKTSLGPAGLNFLIPCGENDLPVSETDADGKSPRFGRPTSYNVTVGDEVGGTATQVPVHYTRVVHLADNLGAGSGVYGRSALEPVFNRLLDLRKVVAASAEGYWKASFPGISFETVAEVVGRSNMNRSALQTEYANFLNGSQRGLFLDGVSAKPLTGKIPDPTPFAKLLVQLIAADADIPEKVLLGAQVGHQAGQDDLVRWRSKVKGRCTGHLTPNLVLPLCQLLIDAGVCRPNKKPLQVYWPDVVLRGAQEQADAAVKTTQALLQYVTSGAELVMPLQYFLAEVMGYEQSLVAKITSAAGKSPKTKAAWKDTAASGAAKPGVKRGGTSRNGAAAKKKTK